MMNDDIVAKIIKKSSKESKFALLDNFLSNKQKTDEELDSSISSILETSDDFFNLSDIITSSKNDKKDAPIVKKIEAKKKEIEIEEEDYESTYDVDSDFEFDQILNDFISGDIEEDDDDDEIEEIKLNLKKEEKKKQELLLLSQEKMMEKLNDEEKALFEAYINFKNSTIRIAEEKKISIPSFRINPETLYPKYKPSIGRAIANDSLSGWDILIKAHKARLESINANATDEELLDFAEKTTDPNLQIAIISYIEILIEIESCEISYEKRRVQNRRKRIEKEIYLEHLKREEKIKKYIEKLKKKKFPINEEQLVKNYFKSAKKDSEGAYNVLINSPAVFSPIDHKKIKARFFGLISPTPQDGIRMNRKIGFFLKHMRV